MRRLPLAALLLAATPAAADPVVFLHALDDAPIEFTFRPDQTITPAVEAFHATGENAYAGDPARIEEGRALYRRLCQACHMPDGTGRIGPNLTDAQSNHDRTGTLIGQFEIVYAGGAGAMQAFGKRIDQDEILKILAFVATLRRE